jgi:hypothetical protein
MKEIDLDPVEYAPRNNIFIGADVFFVLAGLSIINSLIVYFLQIRNLPIAFAFTQWIDGTTGAMTPEGWNPPLSITRLAMDILIAIAFAGFGWFARRGSDLAFVVGMFLYVVDAMLSIGLREFWGFGFHLIALFFIFKGLLASRHARENAISY